MTETSNRLSIVVPAYNEENTILQVLEKIQISIPWVFEVVVVDDGSTDCTASLVEEYAKSHASVHLIRMGKNGGKASALKAGFKAFQGDIVIIQDADLEYDPAEIPMVIDPILSNRADVVYGSRFLVRRASRILYYKHYLANKFITSFSNLLTDLNFTDVETGYKAFRAEIIRGTNIRSRGFGIEIELTAMVARRKARVYEVPISYYGRTYEEGKKIGFKDGFYALWCIVRFNLFK